MSYDAVWKKTDLIAAFRLGDGRIQYMDSNTKEEKVL